MTRIRQRLLRIVVLTGLLGPALAVAGPLHDAAKTGDIDAVKRLLAQGIDVNGRDENQATALHWAAYSGHADIARLLIAKGADVYGNETNHCLAPVRSPTTTQSPQQSPVTDEPNGVTPLHWAAAGGQRALAELLIAEGANVNAASVEGVTPLAAAVAAGHENVAVLLREHGAQ
jgi:uncharacterized protein